MKPARVFRRHGPAGPAALLTAVLWFGALVPTSVQAAPPKSDLQHRVVAGDTLQGLGERYLRAPSQWRELQTLNKIADPQTLVPGTVIRVPRRMLRPAGLATARIEFVEGLPLGTTSGSTGPGATPADDASAPLAAGIGADGGLIALAGDADIIKAQQVKGVINKVGRMMDLCKAWQANKARPKGWTPGKWS